MKTITQYYNISGPVPFVDVDVDVDNYRFIDPAPIRWGYGPAQFAASAVRCMSTFFDEITQAVVSGNATARRRGLDLLQHFEEPRETRFGMAQFSFNGHGGADGVGQDIWDALNGNLAFLVQVGVLHEIEDIPLFVAGVGNDITSDLITRVIFGPLVDFTNDCIGKFPQLAGGTGLGQFTRQIWNPATLRWELVTVTLPTVNAEPLLLVPNEWATHNLQLNATRLFDTALLSHVQMERAVITSKGRILKTPKDRLREDPRLNRSYDTIIRIVEEAYGKGTDIVADFKRWAQNRYGDTA